MYTVTTVKVRCVFGDDVIVGNDDIYYTRTKPLVTDDRPPWMFMMTSNGEIYSSNIDRA